MSDQASDGAAGSLLPQWFRWPHVASVIVGATLGGILGLIFFGYPPARVLLPDDEPGLCGRPDPRAVALATKLRDVANPTSADFHADRCGEGLRAWGTPLRPTARSQWMGRVTETVRGGPMEDVLAEWREAHQRLTRKRQRLTDSIAEEEQQLQAELAAVGVRSAISVLDDAVPEVDTDEVVDLASSVNTLRAERDEIDTEQKALSENLRYAQQIADRAAVLPPTTGAFSAALGAIIGSLAALVTLGGVRLLATLRPRVPAELS